MNNFIFSDISTEPLVVYFFNDCHPGPTKPNNSWTAQKTKIFFAGWQLNIVDQTLTSPEGKSVGITSSEYQILEALTKQPSTVVSRDDILAMISGREWSPLDRSADMAISKLRKKIEKDPKNPELIKTIRNKGYQLTAEVEYNKTH